MRRFRFHRVSQHPRYFVKWLFLLCLYPACSTAERGQPLAIRSHNPFTQVFGLPDFPSTPPQDTERWHCSLSFDVINHADGASSASENIRLDGETYITRAALNYPLSPRWRAGVDIPYLRYGAGHLDGHIKNWHDVWGISNNNRGVPDDRLFIDYAVDQRNLITIDESISGIGDVRLWLARTMLTKQNIGMRIVTRAMLKVPSGDSEHLLGSGATDLSWDIAVQKINSVRAPNVLLSAHLGALALGKGKVLPDQQERVVPYGGISAVWKTHGPVDLIAQVQGQGRYFESHLDELGGTTLQLAFGIRYHWPRGNTELEFGLVEDLVSDVTPDVAFHFQLSKTFR